MAQLNIQAPVDIDRDYPISDFSVWGPPEAPEMLRLISEHFKQRALRFDDSAGLPAPAYGDTSSIYKYIPIMKPIGATFAQYHKPLAKEYTVEMFLGAVCYTDLLCDTVPECIQDEASCPVCLDLMVCPKMLNCGHTVCVICIDTIGKVSAANNSSLRYDDGEPLIPCPICRVESIVNLPDNITVKKIIGGLKIVCSNKGCSWIGTIGNLQDHLGRCSLSTVKCNYCTFPMSRTEFETHRKECPDFVVECVQCKGFGKRSELEKHLADYCSFRLVNCGMCNKKVAADDIIRNVHVCSTECDLCSIRMLTTELKNHQEKTCSGRQVVCTVCKETFTALDMSISHIICPYRLVPCKLCNVDVPFVTLEQHWAQDCVKRLMKCTICGEQLLTINLETHNILCEMKRDEIHEKRQAKLTRKMLKKYGRS